MKKIITACATVVFLATSGLAQAMPVTITFDGLASGVPVTNQYSGVTFSNTQTFADSHLAISSPNLIEAISSGFFPKATSPIVATFSNPVSMVSIYGVDVGANGIQLDAYNAAVGGSLLASDSFIGTSYGSGVNHLLSVSASGIRRVEFYQPLSTMGTGDDVGWDNLTYNAQMAVPEPNTLAVFAFGLASLAAAWRRKRRL